VTTLLSRVRAATGADRELDEQIAIQIAGFKPTLRLGDPMLGNERTVPQYSPPYTASLDAALALVEKVRPEAHWIVQTTDWREAKKYSAEIVLNPAKPFICYDAPTPALALLAALLTSLEEGT